MPRRCLPCERFLVRVDLQPPTPVPREAVPLLASLAVFCGEAYVMRDFRQIPSYMLLFLLVEIDETVIWVRFSKLAVLNIPLNFSGCFKTLA